MRDFNFFQPYLEKTEQKKDASGFIFIAIILAFILSAGGFTVYQNILIKKLEAEKVQQEKYLNSKEIQEKLKELNENKRKKSVVQEYRELLLSIKKDVYNADVIGKSLIDNINSTMPQDVFLETLKFENGEIEFSGISAKRVSIAEFQNNLKELKLFQDVYVQDIQQEEENSPNFKFNLKCKLKDGDR